MSKRTMKIWTDALDSGEFRQTKGALAKRKKKKGGGYNFCCLGVAEHCRMIDQYGEAKWIEEENRECHPFDASDIERNNVLSRKGRDWLGVNSADPKIRTLLDGATGLTEVCHLSELNDEGRSFQEISKLIKEQL